jgi:outer membrane protein assembly factor BamB
MLRPMRSYRIAIVAILLMTILFQPLSRDPHRHDFRPQTPIETRPVWRSLRTAWTFRPGISGYHERISDLLCRVNRIFYVCECEVGCIEKSTGQLLWRYPFVTPSEDVTRSPDFDWWKITVDNRCIYISEGRATGNPAPASFQLRALSIATGKLAWERSLAGRLLDRPCLADDLLLVPMGDGTVLAINRDNGGSVWRKRVANGDPSVTQAGMVLQAADGIAIAQVGAGRLVAFHVNDGSQLWAYPSGVPVEGGDSEGVTLKDGMVYAFLACNKLLAIEATSGRQLWARETSGSGSPCPAVVPSDDLLVTRPFDGAVVAVDRNDGHTVWLSAARHQDSSMHPPISLSWRHDTAANDNSGHALFAVMSSPPRLNGVQKQVRSLWSLDTLVMLDPSTGGERWRWQPEDGLGIDRIDSDGDRFYISDGDSLRAVEEGSPLPLPTSLERRREMAQRMVLALTHRLYAPVQTQEKYPLDGPHRPQTEPPGDNEAKLTLLRLGFDSGPALLDFVSKEVKERDASLPRPGTMDFHIYTFPDSLADALDLLSDIGDRSCTTALVDDLKRATHPISRKLLAEALIRLGDPRAVPILFRYAQSATDCPSTRQDALYWVCRATKTGLPQRKVTDYLLTCLSNRKALAWLRLFARFELLNDRGAKAAQAARVSFVGEEGARLLPANPVMTTIPYPFTSRSRNGFPTSIYPESVARDATGRFWAAFRCDYLGDDNDLWVAQSNDGKLWTNPAFGMNLATRCIPGRQPGTVAIRLQGQIIEIDWTEVRLVSPNSTQTFPHHDRLAIADLYRDSDGDGLPDLLEKEIGTDPHNRDTNGNGLPDNLDKNPTYRSHVPTDEEGIFQAAVEALCQVGSSSPGASESPYAYQPFRLGGCRLPLVLHLPPGSAGVRILGHPGAVIARPLITCAVYPPHALGPGVAPDNCLFTPPHIDFAGHYHAPEEERQALDTRSVDYFTNVWADSANLTHTLTFRDYFPYVRSVDGLRARVGWEECKDGPLGPEIGFDIEVRKIHSHWVPVECRRVHLTGQHEHEEAVIPQVPTTTPAGPDSPGHQGRGNLFARR